MFRAITNAPSASQSQQQVLPYDPLGSFFTDPFALFDSLNSSFPFGAGGVVAFPRADAPQATSLMRLDFKENQSGYELHADVPGVSKDGIKLELEGHVLHITASASSEKKDAGDRDGWKFHRVERTSAYGHRQLRLPAQADLSRISAHTENGVLRVVIPKKATDAAAPSRTAIPIA